MLLATNELKVFPGKDRGRTKRLCYCDCGNETWVVSTLLHNGNTKSCGCHQRMTRSLSPGQAARNQVLDGYVRDAQKRGFEWDLTDNAFDALTSGDCFYCGQPPAKEKVTRGNNGSFLYNGIDRKDSSLGYHPDNVVSCCYICNRAKNSMSYEDFVCWLDTLTQYRGHQCLSL